MSRIRAELRLSGDSHLRQQQRAYLAEREITVLREAGLTLWVSCTDTQLPRLTEQGITVSALPDIGVLELPALAFDPALGDPEPPAELAAPSGQPYWLVLFAAPPAPEWLDAITDLGGALVREVPVLGGVFRLEPDSAPAIAALDFVAWTGPFHPAYAVDFTLTTRGQPFTTATLRELQISPDALPAREGGNLLIGLFDDIDPEQFQALVAETGATVQFFDRWSIVAQADATQAQGVARIPGVAALATYAEPEPDLDRSRVIVATDQVSQGGRTFLLDVTGAGEIAGVMDTGLDNGTAAGHGDLAGRVIAAAGQIQADANGHGTHVAGIIAGNGAASVAAGAPAVTGVAPAAFVFPQRIGGNAIRNLMFAYRAGVRSHNNSWSQVVNIQNRYQNGSSDLDRFCYTHPDLLVVHSAGNREQDIVPAGGDGALDMNRLTPEKLAKNILVVGASENVRANAGFANNYRALAPGRYNNAGFNAAAGGAAGGFTISDNAGEIGLFSNRGPVNRTNPAGALVNTGRVRPNIVAPGTNIISLRSSASPVPAGTQAPPAPVPAAQYRVLTGTSQSTPHVTGAGLLARQYYRAFFRLLRRPRLLEEVASGPPATAFVDTPAACPHSRGMLLAWLTPITAGSPAHLVANRTSSGLVPVDPAPVRIGTDVGAGPSPRVARHGTATLVLHRQKNNGIQLRRLKEDLTAEPAFGTAGVVTVTGSASTTAERTCALLVVGDQAAVAWVEDASGVLRFRLFNATTGATVGPVRDLGTASALSPHGAMAHDGTRFALAWIDSSTAGHHRVRFQRLDASGAPIGASAILVDEATLLRDPHLAWDSARRRYLLAWCHEIGAAGAVIRLRFLDAAGAVTGGVMTPVGIPGGRTCRRPYVAPHPVHSGVLAWEDDTHDQAAAANFDVYATILGATGAPLAGIPADPNDPMARNVLRISDTPLPTSGFTAHTAADGSTVVVWQSADEINSDRRGAYALVVTADGTLLAQADPRTPMIRGGAYVNHTVSTYAAAPILEGVSAVWAGGQRFLLRMAPQPAGTPGLELMRTIADGVAAPARVLPAAANVDRHTMLWTGQQIIVVTAPVLVGRATVQVLDAQGAPVAGLAPHTLREDAGGGSTPELGFVPGAAARILVAYSSGLIVGERIRLATLDAATLADIGAADVDLLPPVGVGHVVVTARHGWFQFVSAPENLLLAAFTDRDATGDHARIARHRRNAATGALVALPVVPITAVAGETTNAVIAPRPVGVLGATALQRQHLAAFQFRAAPANPWEIRVSRLGRDGAVLAVPGSARLAGGHRRDRSSTGLHVRRRAAHQSRCRRHALADHAVVESGVRPGVPR